MGEAIASRSLRDWQKLLDARHGRIVRARTSAERILNRITVEKGKLSKAVRKHTLTEQFLAQIGFKLMNLAVFLGIDAERALWMKHPGYCVYCQKPIDCKCVDDREDRHKQLAAPSSNARTLADLQASLELVHGATNRKKGIISVLAHLEEELGELADEILEGDIQNTDEEFADAVAWWLAAVTLCGYRADNLLCLAMEMPETRGSYITPRP